MKKKEGKIFIKGTTVVFAPLLPAYVDAEAFLEFHQEMFGCRIQAVAGVIRQGAYTSYFSKDELDSIGKHIEEGGVSAMKGKVRSFYKHADAVNKWIEKRPKDHHALSDKRLCARFRELFAVSKPMMPYIPYIRYAEEVLYKKLPERLRKGRITETLATPDDIESAFIQEKKHLLRIAHGILTGKASFEEEVETHLDRFAWTPMHASMDDPLSRKEVQDSLKALLKEGAGSIKKKLDEADNHLMTIKKAKELLRGKEEISAGQEEILAALEKLARIRIVIQDKQSYLSFLSLSLFEEIASRLGSDAKTINWLRPGEIISLLESGRQLPEELKARIKSRKRLFVLAISGAKLEILEGEDAEKTARSLEEETRGREKSVRGQSGNRGKARGRATIVRTKEDFGKVKDGDVLVTVNTTPNFIPVLKRVKAVVTDVGGVTSHAAIVSREMGIPCVVGTKVATAVFKDGDTIEVDADQGTVRKA